MKTIQQLANQLGISRNIIFKEIYFDSTLKHKHTFQRHGQLLIDKIGQKAITQNLKSDSREQNYNYSHNQDLNVNSEDLDLQVRRQIDHLEKQAVKNANIKNLEEAHQKEVYIKKQRDHILELQKENYQLKLEIKYNDKLKRELEKENQFLKKQNQKLIDRN